MADLAMIQKINDFGKSHVRNQREAVDLCKKIFPGKCIDCSVIPTLLPTFIKWLSAGDHIIQANACTFISNITEASDDPIINKANTKLIINANALPDLVSLLSTSNVEVLEKCLDCLANIAYEFPQDVVATGVIPKLVKFLKMKDENVNLQAASLMNNICYVFDPSWRGVSDTFQPLVALLESKKFDVCEQAVEAISKIVSANEGLCQRFIDLKALKAVKRFLKHKSDMQFFALIFIKSVTKYGEKQIDEVIGEKYLPSILQMINSNITTLEIRNEAVVIIRFIIKGKKSLIPTLMKGRNNIISKLSDNLQSQNNKLLGNTLHALCDLMDALEYNELCREQFKIGIDPIKLEHLLEHEKDEIKQLSKRIIAFIDGDVKPFQAGGSIKNETSIFDEGRNENVEVAPLKKRPRRKRPLKPSLESVGPETRSKRSRTAEKQRSVDLPDFPDNGSRRGDAGSLSTTHFSQHQPTSFLPNNGGVAETNDEINAINDFSTNQFPGQPSSLDIIQSSAPAEQIVSDAKCYDDSEKAQFQSQSYSFDSIPGKGKLCSLHNSSPTNVSPNAASNIAQAEATSTLRSANSPPPTDVSPNTVSIIGQTPPKAAAMPRGDNVFESFVYIDPGNVFLTKCCKLLGIEFNRIIYNEFLFPSKIQFLQISANSKPEETLSTEDKSGFGALSLFFTGTEKSAQVFQKVINNYFHKKVRSETSLDSEKIVDVIRSSTLTEEHFEAISEWFGCRFLVYCNSIWKTYGDWKAQEEYVPLFVMEKLETDDDIFYQIVLSLKDE